MITKSPAMGPLYSSDSPDWCTPPEVLEPVRAFAPIRFDPFSNANSLVGALQSVCLPQDSLVMNWPLDGVIWCNPPYGRELARCAAKIAEQARRGAEILTLVPARTDTSWWAELAPRCWCAWRGRITFLEEESAWRARMRARLLAQGKSPEAAPEPKRRVGENMVANESAPFPAALCYHGRRAEAFASHFERYGTMYVTPSALGPAKGGRPRAELLPEHQVRGLLQRGLSIRQMAFLLGAPKNRIEKAIAQLPERAAGAAGTGRKIP